MINRERKERMYNTQKFEHNNKERERERERERHELL